MPKNNKIIWLFSGTSDGNQIAKNLISENFRLKVFVASQYGKSIAEKTIPQNIVEMGRLTKDDIFEYGQIEAPEQIIDATHPFAVEISKNLMNYCKTCQTSYIRYERPEEIESGDNIHIVENVETAAEKARTLGKRILLTLGSKNIEPFLGCDLIGKIFIRMLPDPVLLQQLLSKGIAPDRIIAIQGPFSTAFNQAILNDRSIGCLVTKSSGKEGGVPEKIAAAKQLGCSVVIIKRPAMNYPVLFTEEDELFKYVAKNRY